MLPTHDASKVKASGPGLNTTGVPASLPVEFTIDAKDAGEGLLTVQITVSQPAAQPCWFTALGTTLSELEWCACACARACVSGMGSSALPWEPRQ